MRLIWHVFNFFPWNVLKYDMYINLQPDLDPVFLKGRIQIHIRSETDRIWIQSETNRTQNSAFHLKDDAKKYNLCFGLGSGTAQDPFFFSVRSKSGLKRTGFGSS